MASAVEICNLALSHLRHSKRIASFSEQSEEARLCSLFYETTRDLVLRDVRWPFATTTKALGLIEEQPNTEWAYSYEYPSDCLLARRILSGVRNDTRAARVPYKIAYDDGAKVLFCDRENAVLEYTVAITDTSLFAPDFVMALSYRLAFYLAPTLTGGDPDNLGQRAMQMYALEKSAATANAFNEQQDEEIPQAELINFRE